MGLISLDIQRYFTVELQERLFFNDCIVFPGAVSKTQILHFAKNTTFDRIRIHVRDSSVIFLHIHQKMHVYSLEHSHSMRTLGLTCVDLVHEVSNFIRRGHSLRHADCLCHSLRDTMLGTQRQADYGLWIDSTCAQSQKRKRIEVHACFLRGTPTPKNCEEICREIGAESMETQITPVETLKDVLLRSGCFVVQQDAHSKTVWSMKSSDEIGSHAELLSFVRKHKLGVHRDHHKLQYKNADLHINALRRTNDILYLRNEQMLYANPLKTQTRCDADIRVLWHSTRGK